MAVRRIARNGGTFALALAGTFTPMARSIFYEFVNPLRLLVLLMLLLFVHVLRYPRVFLGRELVLYAVFICYMFFSLLWAPDTAIGFNTLLPAVNFLLLAILFGSLIRYHDVHAVLAGMLAGFLVGAAAYTLVEGFPFVRPEEFSYNAIAGMYIFGLFTTLIFGWFTGSRALTVSIAVAVLAHIAATTSIKTSLGILVGVVASGIVYFRYSLVMVLRNVVRIMVVVGVLVYAFTFNEGVVERVQAGIDRVSLGVEILQAREDLSGSTSFALREQWVELGLEGWIASPVFGHGVEAFRFDYGMTSHSVPIDLLYNTGLIGFVLFYAIFASFVWRLVVIRNVDAHGLQPLIFGALVYYLFVTLSGTIHYQYYLAIFVGTSAALLVQHTPPKSPSRFTTVLSTSEA